MRAKFPSPMAGVRSALGVVLAVSALLACPRTAHATDAVDVKLDEDTSAAAPAAPAKPAPDEDRGPKKRIARYSLPWQLRPVSPVNMVRSDNSFAFYGVGGSTIISELGASYKIIPQISILARVGFAEASPPDSEGRGGFGLFNPLLGAQAGFWPAKGLRLGFFLGVTLPVGLGGGTNPDPGSKAVNYYAMLARSGFDNPLFMPDYLTGWPGVDIAYVTHGLTLQLETSLELMAKVRGPITEKSSNVDWTLGFHAGYYFFPWLSAGLDFRYQRWLSKPSHVAADPTGESRDITTIEPGLRFHVKLSDTVTFRPGLAMAFGLDNPMAGSHYKVLHIDLPFSF